MYLCTIKYKGNRMKTTLKNVGIPLLRLFIGMSYVILQGIKGMSAAALFFTFCILSVTSFAVFIGAVLYIISSLIPIYFDAKSFNFYYNTCFSYVIVCALTFLILNAVSDWINDKLEKGEKI